MLKLAICDDEKYQREEIVDIIVEALRLKNKQYKIFQFDNGEDLISSPDIFDIYFLTETKYKFLIIFLYFLKCS